MGTSTNGQICYGIAFDEGHQFPWRDDIEHWWLFDVLGFRHSFEIYDNSGNYLDGVRPPQAVISQYYGEKFQFAKNNPLPVSPVNYCSIDYPMIILAVPSTLRACGRGTPLEFNPEDLQVSDEERQALLGFCQEHNIEVPDKPMWHLSSYWG